ncbi:hypothetical protein COE20_10830 [Bacillus cereus]|nr:hypothetical protein COE20_10830 [Bacillus cereus]
MVNTVLEFLDYETGREKSVFVDAVPDKCPICHSYGLPINVSAIPINVPKEWGRSMAFNERERMEIVFQCPKNSCQSVYIAEYEELYAGAAEWTYFKSKPSGFKGKEFTSEIGQVSQSFIEIYHQSEQAESEGLNHIAGMGYRKALEFLIKDYLINSEGQNRNEIEKKLLGKCINENISEQRIKDAANRAAWLGNDETHYVRRWVDKDVNDLKILIDLTVYWISAEITQARFLVEMQK